jgi:hypothetical protein
VNRVIPSVATGYEDEKSSAKKHGHPRPREAAPKVRVRLPPLLLFAAFLLLFYPPR